MTDLTKEELFNQVIEKLREGSSPRTKETVRASRTTLLNQMDDTTKVQLEGVQECGVEVGDMFMEAKFWYNKDLEAWELEQVAPKWELTIPHPIQRLNMDLFSPQQSEDDAET